MNKLKPGSLLIKEFTMLEPDEHDLLIFLWETSLNNLPYSQYILLYSDDEETSNEMKDNSKPYEIGRRISEEIGKFFTII